MAATSRLHDLSSINDIQLTRLGHRLVCNRVGCFASPVPWTNSSQGCANLVYRGTLYVAKDLIKPDLELGWWSSSTSVSILDTRHREHHYDQGLHSVTVTITSRVGNPKPGTGHWLYNYTFSSMITTSPYREGAYNQLASASLAVLRRTINLDSVSIKHCLDWNDEPHPQLNSGWSKRKSFSNKLFAVHNGGGESPQIEKGGWHIELYFLCKFITKCAIQLPFQEYIFLPSKKDTLPCCRYNYTYDAFTCTRPIINNSRSAGQGTHITNLMTSNVSCFSSLVSCHR